MHVEKMTAQDLSQLDAKKLAVCPICGRTIKGSDLGLKDLFLDKITHIPFSIVYCHRNLSKNSNKSEDIDFHAVVMYMDADFSVRGIEPADFIIINNE